MSTVTQVLKYVVTADTQQAAGGFKTLSAEAESTGGKLEGLLQKSPLAQQAMGKLGIDAGMAAGGVGQLAASLGPAAIGAVLTKGISDFQNLAGEVLKFQRVTGSSSGEASRWVEVLGDYNITADQGAAAIGKFAKVIGTSPGVLARYGVEIQKNKDGTVDLNGTLLKASDVFRNTTDETKRAALGAALFGKSWQDMVPILEKGSGDIRAALDSVAQGKVLSSQDLADAEDFRLAIDGLKDVVESLSVTVGKQLVPQLKDMAETVGMVGGALDNKLTKPAMTAIKWLGSFPVEFSKKMAEYIGYLGEYEAGQTLATKATKVAVAAIDKAADAVEAESKIVREGARLKGEHADVTAVLADKERRSAEATKLAEKAASDYAKQLSELTKRNDEVLKATDALTRANEIDLPAALDDVTGSLLAYYETTKESQDAQKGLSESSAEYQLEAIRQRDAGRDLSEAMLGYAKETLNAAESQALLTGKQLTAEEKAIILQSALKGLGEKFPPLKEEADKMALKFDGMAGAAEDAGDRMATAMEAAATRIAAAFTRIDLKIGSTLSGLSLLTGTADQYDLILSGGTQGTRSPVDPIANYEKRNGPGWRT